jgi:hypothetical protein
VRAPSWAAAAMECSWSILRVVSPGWGAVSWARRGEASRGGKGSVFAELISEARFDRCGLRHPDSLADDRPGRGLIGV